MEKPIIAGLKSIKLEMEPGEYAWCACGHSKIQPFCDGSHKVTSIKPVKTIIKEKGLVKWCSCKMTHTPPFCDHTHRQLPGYVK
jgi:CDGSH iron-sulfur domain-containing protein 3